ncbi:MAG: two-component system sensor histidine kinase NtrB [Terriglobales bacterium]
MSKRGGFGLYVRQGESVATAAIFGGSWLLATRLHLFTWLLGHFHTSWLGDFLIASTVTGGSVAAMAARQRAATRRELARRPAIEDRLQASEGEAREAAFQTRMLLESTEDGIYALDPEGCCLWSNPAAARILGYESPGLLIGRQMHEMIHHTRPDGTPYPVEECGGLMNLKAEQRIVQAEELLWRADGTSFYADVRVNPMVHEGKMVGAVVVFRDLTERLRLEAQYRQAHKMEAVGRLAAGIAHDFNNLLSVIIGNTELLLRQADFSGAKQQRLEAIRYAGSRAAVLTQQLLAFSRQQAVKPRELQLNEVVRSAKEMLGSMLGEDVAFEVELAPDLERVTADAGQIEQVLMNLAVNARDAMPEGGRLHLTTENATLDASAAGALGAKAGRYAMLAVTDTGVGMDEETRRHIFEPFFTTKPLGKGTGLGLATVFGIVQQSGGALAVDSEPGRGTAVRIFLPGVGAGATIATAAEGG